MPKFFSSLDDILALTVDGKTLVTYNESNPFAINFFAFAISGPKNCNARFYYNCTSNINDVSIWMQFPNFPIQL